MSDLRASLTVDLAGNLAARSKLYGRALGQFAQDGERDLGRMARMSRTLGQGLDRLGNRYTALLTGAGAAGTIKMVADLEERMTYLGINAGKSAEEMDALKKKIFEVAQSPDIRVDPSQIMDAIDSIIERTGDFGLMEDNIRNIGLAIRAAGLEGQDAGLWISELGDKFNIKSAEAVIESLDHSINAAKAGSFAFRDYASQGSRLAAAYAALGRQGPTATAEIDAVMQMINKGVGSPEMAATAFEALLRTLNDADKVKKLHAVGIQLTDPEDPKRMRSVVDIMKEIITSSGGNMVKLSQVFDAEAIRALTAATAEWQKTGGFSSLDKFLNAASDGKAIQEDSARAAKTFNAAWGSLITTGRKFADSHLTEPVRDLADAIDSLDPDTVESTMKALAIGGTVLGGLVLANKTVGLVRGLGRTLGLFGKGKGGLGAALGAAAGATPVIVTNWPIGFGMGAGGGLTRGGAAARGMARGGGAAAAGLRGLAGRSMNLLGKVAGKAAVPLTVLMSGIDFAQAASQGDGKGMAGAAGGLGGGLAGAVAGAALGSVVPVIGTAVGGIVGGVLGSFGGEGLGRMLADVISGDAKTEEPTQSPVQAPVQAPVAPSLMGEVVIRFENSPVGMRVKAVTGQGINLRVDQGLTMAEAGG